MKNKYDAVMSRIGYEYIRGPHPVTADDLTRFETELGFQLPTDYRTFLMKYGFSSGDVRLQLPDDDEGDGTSIDVFYGLGPDDAYDIRERRKTFADRLPKYLLPFVSGSGGEFCLCLSGDNYGRVYWWFQEMGTVESEDELEPITESFDEFMNSLVREEDE